MNTVKTIELIKAVDECEGVNEKLRVASDTFLYINKEKAATLSTESSSQWLEQLKNYDFNVIIRKHTGKSQEKFADRDISDYSHITEMQTQLNEIRATIREIEASEEFKAEMDKLNKAVDSDNAVEGVKAYQQWKQDSGYGELVANRDTLQAEISKFQKEFTENSKSKALKEEQEAIAKSGLSEADYFRKQAVKEFGYTPYFYDAGYIVPNGKMLNFCLCVTEHNTGIPQEILRRMPKAKVMIALFSKTYLIMVGVIQMLVIAHWQIFMLFLTLKMLNLLTL